MAIQLDVIIVIDVEATCWKGDPPHGQEKEIVEIGICLVDAEKAEKIEGSKRSIIVRPEKSAVSKFCTELTNLTQEDVAKGISLGEACRILKEEYLADTHTWASWGDYDKWQFETECKSKNLEFPFSHSHINVKNMFALQYGLKKEVGLEKAMKIMGKKFIGRIHRGADDAYNIALILAELIASSRIKE
ncbi:MAG: exonuclease domain-containing protein [Candidatus Helarchaeota archaeon]